MGNSDDLNENNSGVTPTEQDPKEDESFTEKLNRYLLELYDYANSRQNNNSLKMKSNFTDKNEQKIIKQIINSINKDKQYIILLGGDQPNNYPSLLIKLLKYFSELHRNYKDRKKHFDYAFQVISETCDIYESNSWANQYDDKIKVFLLKDIPTDKKGTEKWDKEFKQVLEDVLSDEASNYKTFYDILTEFAEDNKKYKNNMEQLYEDAYKEDKNANNKEKWRKKLSDHKQPHKTINKSDVIALILTLELDLNKAQALYQAAGYYFGNSPTDKFVKYLIITHKWSLRLYNKFTDILSTSFYTQVKNRLLEEGIIQFKPSKKSHKEIIRDAAIIKNFEGEDDEAIIRSAFYAAAEVSHGYIPELGSEHCHNYYLILKSVNFDYNQLTKKDLGGGDIESSKIVLKSFFDFLKLQYEEANGKLELYPTVKLPKSNKTKEKHTNRN